MKWLMLALCLLYGCASSPGPGSSSVTPEQQVNTEGIVSARIHTELAANYYSRRQYGVALDELGNAIRAFSGYGPAFNMLGLVYMELKDDAKAAHSFEQALKIDPNDSDANNNYGWFLCQRGDPAKSFGYFAAAQRNPLYSTPDRSLVNAGICARKVNNALEAEKYFKQAIAIQPNHAQALFNLADLGFQRGRFEETRVYLTRYLRVANPTAEVLWLAVRAEHRLGDRGAEASFAAQLCRRFAESPECKAAWSGVER